MEPFLSISPILLSKFGDHGPENSLPSGIYFSVPLGARLGCLANLSRLGGHLALPGRQLGAGLPPD